MLDKIATQSNWEIAGSSGVTAAVGLPVIDISVGGAFLKLPLENIAAQPRQKISISGKGAGLGVGLDVGNPISISGSAIFSIRRNWQNLFGSFGATKQTFCAQ